MMWKLLAAFAAVVVVSTCALSDEPFIDRMQPPLRFSSPGWSPDSSARPTTKNSCRCRLGCRSLQRLSRKEGEAVCATLESVDKSGVEGFLDPKRLEPLLTPYQREWLQALGIDLSKVDAAKVMRMLVLDISQIDVRQLKDQCRASQRELDRFASRELTRILQEALRCDDRV